jgi:hypothetical protein
MTCGVWSDFDLYATVGGNLVIAACYYAIPFVGWWLLRRKPGLSPNHGLGVLALWFVLLCGTTHVLDAVMYWWPGYHLNLAARWATALASVACLARLLSLRTRLLAYASPEEYRQLAERAQAMEAEARRMREAAEGLAAARERQVDRLSAELDGLKAQMERMKGQTVTDSDYAEPRRRLHAIRGAS